jgi:hypothetical protein
MAVTKRTCSTRVKKGSRGGGAPSPLVHPSGAAPRCPPTDDAAVSSISVAAAFPVAGVVGMTTRRQASSNAVAVPVPAAASPLLAKPPPQLETTAPPPVPSPWPSVPARGIRLPPPLLRWLPDKDARHPPMQWLSQLPSPRPHLPAKPPPQLVTTAPPPVPVPAPWSP